MISTKVDAASMYSAEINLSFLYSATIWANVFLLGKMLCFKYLPAITAKLASVCSQPQYLSKEPYLETLGSIGPKSAQLIMVFHPYGIRK